MCIQVTTTRYVELLCATRHIMIVLRVTVFAIIIELHSFMGTLNGLITLRVHAYSVAKRSSLSVCLSVCLCTIKYLILYIHHVKRLLNRTVTKTNNVPVCVPDADQSGSIRRISSSFLFGQQL